ncbi:MAG: hypothetical protein SVU32_04670 [Candidatus Nanohaloarchaea archaeon]|nr:hypothetical protein [Candidatus Nanohaloarchaea archaeon]
MPADYTGEFEDGKMDLSHPKMQEAFRDILAIAENNLNDESGPRQSVIRGCKKACNQDVPIVFDDEGDR